MLFLQVLHCFPNLLEISWIQVSKIVGLGSTEHVGDSVACSLVFSTVASFLIKRISVPNGFLYVLT